MSKSKWLSDEYMDLNRPRRKGGNDGVLLHSHPTLNALLTFVFALVLLTILGGFVMFCVWSFPIVFGTQNEPSTDPTAVPTYSTPSAQAEYAAE